MSLVVTQKSSPGNFPPLPEGLNQVTISEVKDLGKQPGPYGEKETVVIRFANEKGEEASKFVSPSLHEKANLTKVVKAVLGAVPKELDLTTLVGTPCQVLVTHRPSQKKPGQIIAKIENVLKAAPGQKAVTPKPKAVTSNTASAEITDSDIPF